MKFPLLQKLATMFPSANIDPDKDTDVEAAAKLENVVVSSAATTELATQLATVQTNLTEIQSQLAEISNTVKENADAANVNFTQIQGKITTIETSVSTTVDKLKGDVSAAIAGMKTEEDTNEPLLKEKSTKASDGKVVKFSDSDWKKPGSQIRTSAVGNQSN